MSQYVPSDIATPQSYAHPEKIDELYTRLRKEQPVVWVESKIYRPFWALTKFADCLEVFSKPEIFNNVPQPAMVPKVWEDERMKTLGRPNAIRSLSTREPPEHTKYRNILQDWFKPASLLKLKSSIAKIAQEYIDKMASFNSECEFVSTISRDYALEIIMMTLGLPKKDSEFLLNLSIGVVAPSNKPEFYKNPEEVDIQILAADEMMKYFTNIVRERKTNPQNDLSSLIANATIDNQPIDEFNSATLCTSLLAAGHDSTGSILSGCMLVFAQHPHLLKKLKNDMTLIPSAIEEMLRWVSPGKVGIRTVVSDCTIRGQKIKAGERVGICPPSANRDEEAIEDPFTVRFDRKTNRHITFGHGIHVCLGQHLVRLEMSTLLEHLLPRLESVEVNGELSYNQSFTNGGLKTLPIKYKLK